MATWKEKRLGLAEVARYFRVAKQTVGGWCHRGCPHTREGCLLSDVIAWRLQQVRAEAEGDGESSHLERYRRARARREELRLEVERGRYVPAERVARWWGDRIVEFREATRRLGQSLAPALQGLDTASMARLIDDRCRAMCDSLARSMEEGMGGEARNGKNEDEEAARDIEDEDIDGDEDRVA